MSNHPPPSQPQPAHRWESLAEQRIREAQAAGEFDHLPGFGQPIPGIDAPHDELWWVREKLKREQIAALPPALALRLDVQQTLERIANLASEADVRREVSRLNERIRQQSLGAAWGPPVDVQPLEIEDVLARYWRKPAT